MRFPMGRSELASTLESYLKQSRPHVASKLGIGRDAVDNTSVEKSDISPLLSFQSNEALYDEIVEKQLSEHRGASSLYMSYTAITPIKLLRVALLGSRTSWVQLRLPLDQNHNLRKTYGAESNKTKFRKLIHRFKTSSMLNVPQPNNICTSIAKEYRLYQRPLMISQLKSIISLLSSTREGCLALTWPVNDKILLNSINRSEVNSRNWSLNKNQGILPESIKARIKEQYLTRECNNLGLNMLSRGIIPGSQLSGKNIKTAASRFQFGTIQKYLDIFHNSKMTRSSSLRQALSALAQNIVKYKNPKNFADISESERTEIIRCGLQILTGWKNDGIPSPSEERGRSFATIPYETDSAREFWLRSYYPTYLCALCDLGLIQTLEAEWKFLQGHSRSMYLKCLFAAVFLLAKKPLTALSVIESSSCPPHLSSDESLENVNPTYGSDIEDIILAMCTHYRMKTTINFRNKLNRLMFRGSTYETLLSLIPCIPPTQVLEEDTVTMDDRNHYIVPKYSKRTSEEGDRYIDWTRDDDGNVGLLIAGKAGTEPLYWRTERMSKNQLWNAINGAFTKRFNWQTLTKDKR